MSYSGNVTITCHDYPHTIYIKIYIVQHRESTIQLKNLLNHVIGFAL